jgi:hypothetical protein
MVTKWIERATNNPTEPQDREISLKRIDMIVAHDALPRLGEIDKPTLVVCAEAATGDGAYIRCDWRRQRSTSFD